MRFRLRTLLILVGIGPPLLAGAWFIPFRGFASNCGGNNAAISTVQLCVEMMLVAAMQSPSQEFQLLSASPQQRAELASIGPAEILVSTAPLRVDPAEPRRVVVVCKQPFTNVPQYLFHRAPPTHAAAF
jgi:hypothetical protein